MNVFLRRYIYLIVNFVLAKKILPEASAKLQVFLRFYKIFLVSFQILVLNRFIQINYLILLIFNRLITILLYLYRIKFILAKGFQLK